MNKIVKKIFFVVMGLFVTAVFLSVIGLGVVNSKKIAFGVSIGGIDIGGLKWEAAKARLSKETDAFLNKKVSISVGDRKGEISFFGLGLGIDLDKSVDLAFQVGREKGSVRNFIEQAGIFLNKKNVDFVVMADNQKINEYLKNFKNYEVELQNASIYFDDMVNDFKMQFSRNGKMVDRNRLEDYLITFAQKLKTGEIDISFKDVEPSLTNEMASGSLAKARDLLDRHSGLNLSYNNNGSWPVDKKIIGGWITLMISDDKKSTDVIFDKNKIEEYLISISQNINEEPVNAVLTYKNDKVQAFTLSHDGRYVNVGDSANKIINALNNHEQKVSLGMSIVKARIDTNEIDNMGLTSLLATGFSDFSGSPANRIHNIKVGAARFNGVLLKPQDEFSFVQILGEVGPTEGYLPELVINKNQVVPEYGGGICQVSTTTFRAAVIAGLEIKERYPHSFPIKYYSPQGFDAAIYPPSPDLKFVNDTPSNLLIQTRIKGTKLYFEFYGTDDGRRVVLTGPVEYDKNSDGSMKTRLTREIFDKEGALIRKTVFRSNYKSPSLYPVKKNPLE